jgi:hypothetical protein
MIFLGIDERAVYPLEPGAVLTLRYDELDALAAGVASHLPGGGLWRVRRPDGSPAFGMCGRLTGYDPAAAERPGAGA